MKYFLFIASTKEAPAIYDGNVFLLATAILAQLSARNEKKCTRGGLGFYIAIFCINCIDRKADFMLTSERSATPGHSSLPRVSWMFPKAKMRVFFSLIIFSFTLATCQEDCYQVAEVNGGKVIMPKACVDPFDMRKHLRGSIWFADDCYRCGCYKGGGDCCNSPVVEVPGCTAVLNLKTCEYAYQPDDPSKRCP